MVPNDRLVYREFLIDAAIRVLLAILIGVITAVAVWLLTTAANTGFSAWHTQDLQNLVSVPSVEWLVTLGSVLLAGSLIVSAILHFSSNGKVSGPPDTLHSLVNPDQTVSLKVGLTSTLVAGVSSASGSSVGLYGPLIHFGGLVAEYTRRTFGTSSISWQTLVGCGVASAISAAFLTPIGAALFATEFVMRRMNLRDFLPLAVASSTAWGIALALGSEPVFQLTVQDFNLGVSSLLSAALLGLFLGVGAMGFTLCVEFLVKWLPPKLPFPVFSPLWAALLLFVLGCFVPGILGTGIPFLQGLFETQHATAMLLVLLVFKIFASAVCIALRFYGGLFAPSLFIGSVIGAVFGNFLLQTSLVGLFDLEGAVRAFPVIAAFAVASALVGAPFAAAIIILEMTQSYEVAALGFSTCVITCYLYSGFMGRSFFDRRLRDRGLSYEAATPVRRLGVTPIRGLAMSLKEIKEQDAKELQQLENVEKGADILQISPETPVLEAIEQMDQADVTFAEVDLASLDINDDRRFVHREKLNELAWELTQTDSQANQLGIMQSRDFVSLYESDLARELDVDELNTLEIFGRLKVVKAGSVVLKTGDLSRNFYILNAGLMRVAIEREEATETVAWLRSGGVFGEISFLTGEPRSADVVAETDCIVQEFQPEFVGLAGEDSSMQRTLSKLAAKRGLNLK